MSAAQAGDQWSALGAGRSAEMLGAGLSHRFVDPIGHLIPRPKYARFKIGFGHRRGNKGVPSPPRKTEPKVSSSSYFCHPHATHRIVSPLITSLLASSAQ